MITRENYFSTVNAWGQKLPETLEKSHRFVIKTTGNGSTWEVYDNNEAIRKVIDLYFEKLDEFFSSQRKSDQQKVHTESITKTSREHPRTSTAIKPQQTKEGNVFKAAYRLLTLFIPDLEVLLGKTKRHTVLHIERGGHQIDCFLNDKSNVILIEAIEGEQHAQFDIRIHNDRKEALVTSEYLSFNYQMYFDREDTPETILERGDDVDVVRTATLVEWLKEVIEKNHRILFKSNQSGQKKARNQTVVTSEKVEHLREEVKFIRRFVRLHKKEKSPESILSLVKSLQRAIVQKLISKTSPFAKEIQMIQDKLVKAYNSSQGKDQRIEINEKDLPKLVAIAGGEEVYPSINIMKRYVSMQGKKVDRVKIDSFIKHIESTLEKKRVAGDDPYYEKVKAIFNTIKKMRAGSVVSMSTAELNGLEGIVKACGCKNDFGRIYKTVSPLRKCKKGTYTDSEKKGACSHNKGLNGVLTAEEMANRQLDVLSFFSFWLSLFGRPAKNFTAMFHGEPHNGKTIFLLRLAQYLADNFGNVLYVSSEEFASPTMTKKVNEFLNPLPARLHFAENLKDPDLSQYQFVILDSINDLGLKINDYKEIRKAHPGTAFIFILQHTKSGDFRGGKDWEHLAEIVGEVKKGVVSITKNRYAPKNAMDFFQQIGLQWQEPKGN